MVAKTVRKLVKLYCTVEKKQHKMQIKIQQKLFGERIAEAAEKPTEPGPGGEEGTALELMGRQMSDLIRERALRSRAIRQRAKMFCTANFSSTRKAKMSSRAFARRCTLTK